MWRNEVSELFNRVDFASVQTAALAHGGTAESGFVKVDGTPNDGAVSGKGSTLVLKLLIDIS